jgi:hypothetical protein
MKTGSVLFILTFLCCLSINSEELHSYTIFQIGNIATGKASGELGFGLSPEGQFTPLTFSISPNGNIYIPDPVNNRICIFSPDLKLIRILEEQNDGELPWAELLKIDSKGNIIYLNTSLGLRKIAPDGQVIFTIRPWLLDKQIKQYKNIHLINDSLFFYNSKNKPEMISEQGGIESTDAAVKSLSNFSRKNTINSEIQNGNQIPDTLYAKIQSIQSEGNSILVQDEFYSNRFRQNQEYYNQIAGIREQIKILNSQNSTQLDDSGNMKNPIILNVEDYYPSFIGYDEIHNGYWRFESTKEPDKIMKQLIVVYSKYGELIEAFQYGVLENYQPDLEKYPTSGALVTIAPNGDVWFMKAGAKQYAFYKVECQW